MNTHKTHELTLSFPHTPEGSATKDAVIDWLKEQGIESFVEGVIDDLDLDHEFGLPDQDFYEEQGGDFAPILLCSFDEAYISDLARKLTDTFSTRIQITQVEMDTESWQTGWKDSFQPILTDFFRINPIWEEAPLNDSRVCVLIEPGMAFGTGQHASTQVCLKSLETLIKERFNFADAKTLDVGTGSGILAIALAKLGAKDLWASDIDKDALIAAKANAASNGVNFHIVEGSIPSEQKFDLILANILYTVLAPMISKLSQALTPNGKIILSGLIEEQAEDMIVLAAQAKLTWVSTQNIEGWVSLLFESRS